jgi:tetratricopeptide (TPR) repeat protein
MNLYSSPLLQPTPASASSRPTTPLSQPILSPSSSTPDPWDFDLLAPTPAKGGPSITSDPFALNFDNPSPIITKPKANVYEDNSYDSPDLLGVLSQPIVSLRPNSTSPSNPARVRSASPPPHILGQLVEMGYSIQGARLALEATVNRRTGEWDISKAVEVLVSQSGKNEMEEEPSRRRENGREERSAHSRSSERVLEEEEPPRPVGRRAREAAAKERERQSNETINATKIYQEQAAELLSQASKTASKIGLNVFKSANAYWETGRASIQKALDERALNGEERSTTADSSRKGDDGRKGRPKWMTEENDHEDDDVVVVGGSALRKGVGNESSSKPPLIFQDSDDEEGEEGFVTVSAPANHDITRNHPAQPQRQSQSTHGLHQTDRTTSPALSARRQEKLPSRQATPPSPQRISRPKPTRPKRLHVHASTSQLSTSTSHKSQGNEYYKIGRFAEADSSYSLAIDILPSNHPTLVVVLNNRANARLNTGNGRGAVEDCSEVLRIIFGDVGNTSSLIISSGNQGGGGIDLRIIEDDPFPPAFVEINLRDMVGKALGRRAKAYEMGEKWERAGEDWNALLVGGESLCRAAGGVKLVSEGIMRCRKMTTSSTVVTPSVTNTPLTSKPFKTMSSVPSRPSPATAIVPDAVARLRLANEAASAEDTLKFSLKDSVDTRILAWKAGKETNLRALIASLDNVLWAELGWKTVGMQELITDSQVKVRYVRAIAKVHPDKVSCLYRLANSFSRFSPVASIDASTPLEI